MTYVGDDIQKLRHRLEKLEARNPELANLWAQSRATDTLLENALTQIAALEAQVAKLTHGKPEEKRCKRCGGPSHTEPVWMTGDEWEALKCYRNQD